ncbi:MAG: ABC transporter ATP-binding protein, partial [Streptococcus thermophilus]
MMKETILSVKNLHVNFHTYAGDVKAIASVSPFFKSKLTSRIA